MIEVLRIGHRRERDNRLSTHVALCARALGADKFTLSGQKDKKLLDTVRDVVDRFGGDFTVGHTENWRRKVKEFKGTVVHLTMYGEKLKNKKEELKETEDLLIIVGGEKVPREAYELSDYNISVTNQPHSEVAALALTLDRHHEGKELNFSFPGGEINIHPSKSGKNVERNK